MRYASKRGAGFAEGDMTPMIDMTFQLIAFFMVLVNFSEADQNARIHLPASELAEPPDEPLTKPITLQITKESPTKPVMVIFKGLDESMATLPNIVNREYQWLERQKAGSAKQRTVVIRADREAKTGRVQEVIKICQDAGFEIFALRAKQSTVTVKQGT